MAILHVTQLSQTLQKRPILSSLSLEFAAASITAMLGPNGAGKTTLLKTIMGLLPNPAPSSTHNIITFNDAIINSWPTAKRVEHGILYLPQQTSLFLHMTAWENLQVVYEYYGDWQQQGKSAFLAAANQWLSTTNLMDARNQKANTLSGGQKRKLEIVRSLLMSPKLLLLDEPFAGVDPKSIYELKTIFSTLARDGIAVVISDHNVDQLLSITKNVYVIIQGSVVSSGSIREILENAYTKESYLGSEFYQEIKERFLH